MSAAQASRERNFWSRQLDTTSIEERKPIPDVLHWVDADHPEPSSQEQDGPSPNKRFTLWDI